ncbi:putative C2H2 transcription factor [Talaromyces proteolyticus]|uniref:C2H2 transcription factor n=1 Tax=Talaromyces proteolyticus TaxID=1131652 RepID=A0AAD4KTH6_9EURO|nr:putative C2H2 transcription factor [Talaromyces proteolyticus]KAH8700602.1 putative C2H2 transcription factor [Talaromyces proteolyticus]
MAPKRKAIEDNGTQPNKISKHVDDSISEGSETSFETDSIDNVCHDATPGTPLSVTSSKYPSELKTHLCPFDGCTKAFNRPARLQEHIRSHNNERIFKCTHNDCNKTFLRASHLNHHIKSAHTAVRDYVCERPGCGKTFVTGTRLRRHIAAHDGRDKFRCTEYPPCNETFRKHSTLNNHILLTHLNQKPYPCQYIHPVTGKKCEQAFESAAHLRGHENRAHTENRFICTECASGLGGFTDTTTENVAEDVSFFSSYAELQAHIKSVHPPNCPQCPFICSSSRELRRHLEMSHGDVIIDEKRQFPCMVPGCGRSFTKKGNLTVHIRSVHEGEKRFVCGGTDLSTSKKVDGWTGDGCGKRYGSKLALEEHVRTVHLGLLNTKAERRELLGIKEAKCRSKKSNISTIALLTGEGYADETGRHIACLKDNCDYRFYREYDLWVHMQSKHGYAENEIEAMFMQRALQNDNQNTIFGIYGLDLDDGDTQQGAMVGIDTVQSFTDLHLTGNEFDEKINEITNFNDTVMQDMGDSAGLLVDEPLQSKNVFPGIDPSLFSVTE